MQLLQFDTMLYLRNETFIFGMIQDLEDHGCWDNNNDDDDDGGDKCDDVIYGCKH